ncbi:uncharacterized protein BO66DRAFT_179091 [Aspergillus aculeatinus CBS 121060]|uniref:Uncharacterized protein n=1 Tax=Aspergillus aculeatinus CBS 121060 TaxID=1448322 RepID=A0ACD1HKR9_9EURO|nr:hypothetical protein BO66DRAFT_179091 [Aspergillus aculeatinus CBS 121060]RAH74057.1 hypothetical protein BO66DRAFT_179091 [Aspergillus aculeatinus CBS 121060]
MVVSDELGDKAQTVATAMVRRGWVSDVCREKDTRADGTGEIEGMARRREGTKAQTNGDLVARVLIERGAMSIFRGEKDSRGARYQIGSRRKVKGTKATRGRGGKNAIRTTKEREGRGQEARRRRSKGRRGGEGRGGKGTAKIRRGREGERVRV